jgi:hypothetical protein
MELHRLVVEEEVDLVNLVVMVPVLVQQMVVLAS